MTGVVTVNGVPVVGLNYDTKTSAGILVENLSGSSGTIWDIKNNSLSNPRSGKGLVIHGPSGSNGTRIPVALVRRLKEKDF